MHIPCNSTKFEIVSVTKVYQKSDTQSTEEQELFSSSFRQAGPSAKHSRRERKSEQSFRDKQTLLDPSQPKITNYTIESTELVLNYSSDSLVNQSP